MKKIIDHALLIAVVLLIIGMTGLLFFEAEKRFAEYSTRQCRCACASEYVPPVTTPSGGLIFTPSKGVK